MYIDISIIHYSLINGHHNLIKKIKIHASKFCKFLMWKLYHKSNFKSVLTQLVCIAMNPYIRKKSYNFSFPKMDCIMLKKYTNSKHINNKAMLTGSVVKMDLHHPAYHSVLIDVPSKCHMRWLNIYLLCSFFHIYKPVLTRSVEHREIKS